MNIYCVHASMELFYFFCPLVFHAFLGKVFTQVLGTVLGDVFMSFTEAVGEGVG